MSGCLCRAVNYYQQPWWMWYWNECRGVGSNCTRWHLKGGEGRVKVRGWRERHVQNEKLLDSCWIFALLSVVELQWDFECPEVLAAALVVVDAWQRFMLVTTGIIENKLATCTSKLWKLSSCRHIIRISDDISGPASCPHELAVRQCWFELYIIAQCNVRTTEPIHSICNVGKRSLAPPSMMYGSSGRLASL